MRLGPKAAPATSARSAARPVFALGVRADRRTAERLAARLAAASLAPATWSRTGSSLSRVELFCCSPAEARARRALLRAALAGIGATARIRLRRLPAEDWAEAWKRHFHTARVSPRVLVAPSWEKPAQAAPCVVTLDPGMSFGTGRHATTKLCLIFLDGIQRRRGPVSLLDAGCGSGILAIAGAKLGYAPVAGFDADADAVRIALGNARGNGVGARIEFCVADAACFRPARKFDVVVANLTAPVLRATARRLTAWVRRRPAGQLVASGILAREYGAVRLEFARRGLREARRRTLGGWTAGVFEWGEARNSTCCRSRRKR